MSTLATYFSQQQFCFSIEYIEHGQTSLDFINNIAGYPTCVAIADRVHADEDRAPSEIAQSLASKTSTLKQDVLLHYSGKGRDISDLKQFLQEAAQRHYFDVLMLTGDRLKKHDFGHTQPKQRSRYLESVNSVMYAKQADSRFHLGVAFNPFKYTESEREAQYLKLYKKIQAGADFIVTQLGYDLLQLKQLQLFLTQYADHIPVMVCVMPLTYARAKSICKQGVAGIVITPDLLDFLKQEHLRDAQDAEDKVYQRAALHILIAKHLGFAGIHLSACEQPQQIRQLEHAILQFQHLDFSQCWQKYLDLLGLKDMTTLRPDFMPSQSIGVGQMLKYYSLAYIHGALFNSKVAMSFGRWLFKAQFWQHPVADRTILAVEHGIKSISVGCDRCGQCRLADTLYICPETCPKGLANGPCGGTSLDRCEFGDRECIHSQKYRIAKQTKQLSVLKQNLIATVPIQSRQHSSWVKWFNPEQDCHKKSSLCEK